MENAIIPSMKILNEKIEAIKKDGADSVHILSDFDRTLTHAFYNRVKTSSLISHLRNGSYLTANYAEKATALFNKYHPIELSCEISRDEKSKAMLEWWSSHYKLLVDSGLNETTIKQSVSDLIREGKIRLRNGVPTFLKNLAKNNIPLIILSSAGIGNMVTEFLKEQKLFFENTHFIGNTLEFNEKGDFTGIKNDKIIHILNKHESELKNLQIYKTLLEKKNIILLGDCVEDLSMAEGFPAKTIIKIGFQNYEEENLEEFKKKFDIIITDDGNFEEINKILSRILAT